MSDHDWLYYSVPVTTGRSTGAQYRIWRLLANGRTALCVTYWKGYKPSLVAFNVDRVHISQLPADPPPMPAWARE